MTTDRLTIRRAEANDYPFMREMLYEAIFIPEGEEKPPFSVTDDPEIYKYIRFSSGLSKSKPSWQRHP
ncbi:MAG: hypothetical protein ACQES4_09410 [Bacillota bacterium]